MPPIRAFSNTLYWNKINRSDLPRLGLKCYKLAQHKRNGIPVPPFFAIPNARVAEIISSGALSVRLEESITRRMAELETETNKCFGQPIDPLLVSVRSGDPRSMHGILLSLMNIGLNDATFQGLVNKYGPESRTEALWLYLNLIVDFARQVNSIDRQAILPLLQRMKHKEAGNEALEAMIDEAQNLGRHYPVEFTFPQDVRQQLTMAIKAVADSWITVPAKCAAASLGLGPEEQPSVFVQEMVFSMFTPDSAFVSFLTHPGMQGTYAPQISGRRVMSGIAHNRTIRLDELGKHEQYREQSRQILEITDRLVRIEKCPLNIEMVFEQQKPWIMQITRADLSPFYHLRAINELVESGIISEEQAVRERADAIITKQIKLYKLNPEASYALITEGVGGGSGAMAGLLAITPSQALELSRQQKRVILLATEPHDENVYLLTLGKKIDGIIATYGVGRGSHIADLAMANGIPLILGLKEVEVPETKGEPHSVRIGAKWFRAGEVVVVDGQKGRLLYSDHPEPMVEDKQIESQTFRKNFLEMMHSVSVRYSGSSYQEILEEHAREVKDLLELEQKSGDRVSINGQKARIHCLHRLARKIGQNSGLSPLQVDMDVAVADGNLDRVPGLEDKKISLAREANGSYMIVLYTSVEYMDIMIEESVFPDLEKTIRDLRQRFEECGLKARIINSSRKLSLHTNYVTIRGISLPPEELQEVIEILKEII